MTTIVRPSTRLEAARSLAPGILICTLIALSATFLADHYGGPQLLYALLIGLSLHFLVEDPRIARGVSFCGRTLLRLGVALLGARVTWDQVSHLGWPVALAVVIAVSLTIAFGLVVSRFYGRPIEEGLISGCAVGICGASAALAVATVLPATDENERFTLLAVVGVTLLSTVAMVLYPFALQYVDLNPAQAAIFIGGTIHDVAQVVAAGMMLGSGGGELAALVKLLRVLLLMPVVLLVAAVYRRSSKSSLASGERPTVRPPVLPFFLIGFLVLLIFSSLGLLSPPVRNSAADASRWLLVVGIAAAGLKTTFEDLRKLGWRAVAPLLAETAFIAFLFLSLISAMGLGSGL